MSEKDAARYDQNDHSESTYEKIMQTITSGLTGEKEHDIPIAFRNADVIKYSDHSIGSLTIGRR